MYARKHRVLLRHYLEQGVSETAIERTLHVSRRTVQHVCTRRCGAPVMPAAGGTRLGYSRLLWFQLYPRQSLSVLIRGRRRHFPRSVVFPGSR